MPTAKKSKTAASAPKKKAAAKKSTKKPPSAARSAPMDWSETIKKAAQDKRAQASWPGTGEAWKKKSRI